ncbi:uncharacterized protein PITG_13807 [Phytophthora infestans T30-4]|uniref:Uncharacterized protein n=1 Tax=Phytophthora infestans (strain T30-4) TaxID=403677 RepID=D0NMU7_PHYIT|nr:uncharacterized protein PITG_13807 [Phytophthora infestans T30-4]EEY61854.1 hypothetical protein PITG_13807 [Phytophthora infestans T30-4]|eukprot:XP_002899494.1 hypothetical protein PITG_13807 [Phytophthora infestans T30-4]
MPLQSVCKLPAPAHRISTGPSKQASTQHHDVKDLLQTATKSECLELFRALKNKDELSHSCKEIMQMITANDKGVMENDALNTHGGSRTRGGISHAALQRRFTGKMSGVRLSG